MVISEIVNKTTATTAQHNTGTALAQRSTATKLNCWQLQHSTHSQL